jgi:CubicO group peptidase (beta-lactamase class C family)
MRSINTLAVILFVPILLLGQENPGASIDSFIKPFADAGHFSGVVLVKKEGKVVFEKAYGLADAENDVPNTKDSVFSIASITKPMTAVILAKYVEAEKIKLEDPLSKYIPDFPKGDKITIEMLARHKSGIPHRVTSPMEESVPSSPAEMVERAKKAKLEFEPGTGDLYSSTGYAVLARVLELVSGKSYSDLLDEFVFAPAGMNASHNFKSGEILKKKSEDYFLEGSEWVTTPLMDYSFLSGAGSVFSTASDVMLFASAVADGKFGEVISSNFVRNGVFSANGSTNGYRCNARVDQNRGFAFVVAANLGSGANDLIIRNLPDLIEGKKVDPAKVPSPKIDKNVKNELEDYVGTYKLGGSGFDILIERDELFAGPFKLLPIGKDKFYSFWSYAEITFERGEDGKVNGLRWDGSGGVSNWVRQ